MSAPVPTVAVPPERAPQGSPAAQPNATSQQLADDSPVGTSASAPKRPRLVTFLVCLVVALLLACSYLIYLSSKWSDFGDATNAANFDLGKQLSATESALNSARTSLENTRSQLNTAQERISELAKEKAQVGDDREEQRLIAEDTTAVATEALGVSRNLGKCVELQSQYLGHMREYLSGQRTLASQLGLDPDDRDETTVTDAQAEMKAADDAMDGILTDLNSTCEAAIERHNKLITDLQE